MLGINLSWDFVAYPAWRLGTVTVPESFCIIFPVDFHLPVVKIKTVTAWTRGLVNQRLAVYSFCVSGCSGTVTLGVFGCHPLVGEFMFRFFSFPVGFFLLLPVKCWSIPSCVLSLRDSWAAVSASVRSRTPPRLPWAQMKGDSLCKGRKISSHKSLLMLNIVGFCLAQLWKLNTDWKSSYQGIMVRLKSQKPDGLRYIYASCYRHVSTALECEEV